MCAEIDQCVKQKDREADWSATNAPAYPPEKSVNNSPHTPCFVAGTEIATSRGPVAIENLRTGDRVLTRDNGYQTIRWIGARLFSADALAKHGDLHPVTIPAGCLGGNTPARDLTVSPQHRILLTGDLAVEIGGESEILVPAIELADAIGAVQVPSEEVTYFHLMFDSHEVILGDGCWSESFLPEKAALNGLHDAQLREILAIFPEIASQVGQGAFVPARLCVASVSRALNLAA